MAQIAANVKHPQLGVPDFVWLYRNPDGSEFCGTARWNLKDDKTFRQFHLNGAGLEWKRPDGLAPLYRADELAKTKKTVLIVAGEKTADAAQKLFPGLFVTTNLGGEGALEKTDLSLLKFRKVILWRDADKAGETWLTNASRLCLFAGASSVHMVDVPACAPDKWDLADPVPQEWRLQEMLDNAIEYRSDAFRPEPANDKDNGWANFNPNYFINVEWLWKNRIVRGRLNLLCGMGEVGKDVLCCTIAAIISSPRPWPDESDAPERGLVGYVTTEDTINDTLGPRLQAAGADFEYVRYWSLDNPPQPSDLIGLRLLIVSPLIEILADGDNNNERDARRMIKLWERVAHEHDVTIIGICHYNKKNDLAAVQRILGSVGIPNAIRNTWCVECDDEDDDLRLFLKVKGNLSKRSVGGLAFRVQEVGPLSQSIVCVWQKNAVVKTVDQVMTLKKNNRGKKPAGQWLVEFLRSKGNMAQQSVIESAGAKEEYSKEALNSAKRRNDKITAERHGGIAQEGEWWWTLHD